MTTRLHLFFAILALAWGCQGAVPPILVGAETAAPNTDVAGADVYTPDIVPADSVTTPDTAITPPDEPDLVPSQDTPADSPPLSDPPTPVAACIEGEEVIPQTVLHLHGDYSHAANGLVSKWQWFVEQPPGSKSVFEPSPAVPDPTFEVNVAGLYTFYLDVWDEFDQQSAQPAMMQVQVIPDEAIHIELLWHTPEDPDETDTGPEAGSDLDLHFLHHWAGGPDLDGDGQPDGWFDQPFDCFWFNAHPEWGSWDPSEDDNPGLDRDDTDGAGPENINLNIPEVMTYRVGVHYWNDHGYGPAYATVRVYIYSQLVFEAADMKLKDKDMWEVCTIEWSSDGGNVQMVTDQAGQHKVTPNYQNPFFFGD